jgi:hypothetical protein
MSCKINLEPNLQFHLDATLFVYNFLQLAEHKRNDKCYLRRNKYR